MVPQALDTVQKVDSTFVLIIGISFAILVFISVLMVFFTIRFSSKRSPEAADIHGNWIIETVWTVIPLFIVGAFFYYGWDSYIALRSVPDDAMEVHVTGQMFNWTFRYDNGQETPALIVPSGKPVKLVITSKDVIHSLFIPAFRIKKDAVPGMETYAWFQAGREGIYEIFCAEYCGTKHSGMTADLAAVSPDLFDRWGSGAISADDLLMKVYEKEWAGLPYGLIVLKKYGCVKCHTIDGSRDVAPTFKGLIGREVRVIREGSPATVAADREYIRRSIENPKADIAAGYSALMSAYRISDREFEGIINYLETIRE